MAETSAPPEAVAETGILSIVGRGKCFCDAVVELARIVAGPLGFVTGEVGVGKMNLIRTLWRQIAGERQMIVLPCGTFFKDYYMGATHRRFGGGRDGIDQINRYLKEADGALLVLHHIDRLPRSLQEDLAVRLEEASTSEDGSSLLLGLDPEVGPPVT